MNHAHILRHSLTAVLIAAAILAASAGVRADDAEKVEAFLARLGLTEYQVLHLEQQLQREQPRAQLVKRGQHLADLYAERLLDTRDDPETYDQVTLPADMLGDQAVYLQEGMEVRLSMHEGVPVSAELPQKVTLEVVDTEPTVKGQTASSSYKPATLSNGVKTMVPPHITAGTRIVVMTADGSYAERAKD